MFASLENWWRTPPALRPVDPAASIGSRSRRTTRVMPRRARWYATLAPMQPPPMITLSALRGNPLDLLHHAQDIAAENFLDVRVGVALLEQRVGDLRQLRRVFHSDGHRRAIEVGSEADVIGARHFHRVIDVFDDLLPRHVRQLALRHGFAIDPLALERRARLVAAAFLRHRRHRLDD